MQEMGSPQVLGAIDHALEFNARQREDLLDLRKMAVRRHGEAPPEPEQPEETATQTPPASTLTINDLIERYKTDADSTFSSLTFKTREHYEYLLKAIAKEHGPDRISQLNARAFKSWHDEWSEGGKIAVSHAKVGMLRRLFGFGATILEDPDCTRLSLVLNKMRFEMPKARTEKMTAEQANAIRAMAHEKDRPSIALAQAIQFEMKLPQKEVIGEWIPIDEPGEDSEITFEGKEKWVRGLRYEDIGEDLMVRKETTYGDFAFDLRSAPMTLEELSKRFGWFSANDPKRDLLPKGGPIIVSEWSALPWTAVEFRRWWRLVADAAGIPKWIKNSDSRKGDE